MFKIFVLTLVLSFSSLIDAQRLVFGTACPSIKQNEDFDVQKFAGKWYVTEYTPSMFDYFLRCTEVEYEYLNEGQLSINLKGDSISNTVPFLIKGEASKHNASRSDHFSVKYVFGLPMQGSFITIVDTDYDEYAVVYTCTNSLLPRLFYGEHIWILTKNRELTNPSKQNIFIKLDKLGINRNGLISVDPKTCPRIDKKKLTDPKKRDGEILNIKANLTNFNSNLMNNLLNNAEISREEEIPTTTPENSIKVT